MLGGSQIFCFLTKENASNFICLLAGCCFRFSGFLFRLRGCRCNGASRRIGLSCFGSSAFQLSGSSRDFLAPAEKCNSSFTILFAYWPVVVLASPASRFGFVDAMMHRVVLFSFFLGVLLSGFSPFGLDNNVPLGVHGVDPVHQIEISASPRATHQWMRSSGGSCLHLNTRFSFRGTCSLRRIDFGFPGLGSATWQSPSFLVFFSFLLTTSTTTTASASAATTMTTETTDNRSRSISTISTPEESTNGTTGQVSGLVITDTQD